MNPAAKNNAEAYKQQQDACSDVEVNLVLVEDVPRFAD